MNLLLSPIYKWVFINYQIFGFIIDLWPGFIFSLNKLDIDNKKLGFKNKIR